MDFKQLRQVLVLAETLNFRSAAERLHMAQPPLSVSIRRLEEEIGVRLFERSRAGVQITPVGKSLLEHARRALFYAEQFRQAAHVGAGGHVGVLRVDFVASSTIWLLPRAISHFRSAYPNVDLQLAESTTDTILVALRDGRTDVGIIRYPAPNHSSITTSSLQQDRYAAALPLQHRLVSKARLRLADLRDEAFILPSIEAGSASYMSTLLACQRAGFMPRMVQQASHARTILALVESGLGVALVPGVWKNLAPRAVRFKHLSGMPDDKIGLAFASLIKESNSVVINNFRLSLISAASQKQTE